MLIRLPEVIARTGLSRSTIYKRIAEGTFPRAVQVGPRTVAWILTEICAWVDATIAQSRRGDPRHGSAGIPRPSAADREREQAGPRR